MKKRGLEGHYILFADQTGQDHLNLQEDSQNMNFSGLQELHNQLTKEIVPKRWVPLEYDISTWVERRRCVVYPSEPPPLRRRPNEVTFELSLYPRTPEC